jgi:hypothetical protein
VTKKRLLLLAAVPITIAVILGVLSILPSRPGVTKANFDRIEEGMTRAEADSRETVLDKFRRWLHLR